MPIPALPGYLQNQDFKDASPGMRFGMYLAMWGINRRTLAHLWKNHDLDYVSRGPNKEKREIKDNKVPSLNAAKVLGRRDLDTMTALLARQSLAFLSAQDCKGKLHLAATATAPFTTGLGNEHPLENGFAFLSPYGLPYLPGSGVKGVLRQAARELASGEWGDNQGWNDTARYILKAGQGQVRLTAADALFGRETSDGDAQHVRGALVFWDVIPQIPGDSLAVDIMTPHQSHYYQGKVDKKAGDSLTPHDSGELNLISFLTVPPGTGFVFHVQCDLEQLACSAPELAGSGHWQQLLRAAFEHAFQWLGFGAKTSVGYGVMQMDQAAAARQKKQRREAEEEARERAAAEAREAALLAMTSALRQVTEFVDACRARHQQHPNVRESPNGVWHNKARVLAKVAHEGTEWTADEKKAAAEAIEEWLPKLVKVDAKDERKKMKLAVLRGLS